jgi:uncharacterized protein
MVIAVLQFDLLIRGAESLKEKRRVVNSVKDKLHHEHRVSVGEVGAGESLTVARLGLALVSNEVRYAAQVLDSIENKLRGLHDAELGDTSREFIRSTGEEVVSRDDKADVDAGLEAELLKYADGDAGRSSTGVGRKTDAS